MADAKKGIHHALRFNEGQLENAETALREKKYHNVPRKNWVAYKQSIQKTIEELEERLEALK